MDEIQKFLYELCKEYDETIDIYDANGEVSVDRWDLKMYVTDVINEMEKQIMELS